MSLDRQLQARRHAAAAQVALAAGALDRARQSLRRAASAHPDLRETWLTTARLMLEGNRPQRALAALDAHDQYHPAGRNDPAVALLRAQALARGGTHNSAVALLQEMARQYADDVRPHRMLAGLYATLGRQAHAVAECRHVLRLAPSDEAVRWVLAGLLAATRPQEAAELMLHAPGHDRVPAATLYAARLLAQAGRLRDAQELYEQLLAENDHDAGLWREAGELAAQNGADELAQKRLRRATAIDAHPAAAWQALATAHMRAGRWAAAAWCWWRAARQEPRRPEVWAGLSWCAAPAGRPRLAERAHARLARTADGRQRRRVTGQLWLEAAVGHLVDQATHRGAGSPAPAPSPLDGLLSRAAGVFEEHARTYPRRADTHHHVAVCREALGQTHAAQTSVAAALRVNPNYAAARKLAGRIERSLSKAA